jgi:hypothetical protein
MTASGPCNQSGTPRKWQPYTLGMDKQIKVWDIRNHKCLQTFHDRQAYRPDNRLGSMLYDPKRRALVAASVAPKAWRLITKDRTTTAGHSHPCVSGMFNQHFQQVGLELFRVGSFHHVIILQSKHGSIDDSRYGCGSGGGCR